MAISNIKAVFQSNLQTVWDTVTSLENYQWRSDLSRIEVVSEKQFIEYTKDGYATTFTITASEPLVPALQMIWILIKTSLIFQVLKKACSCITILSRQRICGR